MRRTVIFQTACLTGVLGLVLGVGSLAVAAEKTGGRLATSVVSKPLKQLAVFPRREASASVVARNESRISAQVSAVLNKVLADAGETVKAGQILAVLDDRDAKLALAQAKARRSGLRARLKLARVQLKRSKELKSGNFVSVDAVNQRNAEVVSLYADLNGANAQVAIAARQLEKCVIRAPFNGVVSKRTAQLGELMSTGTPLFTLVQVGAEEVSADLPVQLASGITQVKSVTLLAAGRQVLLKLSRLSPVISRQTRTQEARFEFTSARLPAGSEGRVVWADPQAHLPPNLLVRRDGQLGVFVAQGGKANFVALAGAQEGRAALVPLPLSTQIVVTGQAMLQSGDAVNNKR